MAESIDFISKIRGDIKHLKESAPGLRHIAESMEATLKDLVAHLSADVTEDAEKVVDEVKSAFSLAKPAAPKDAAK